MERVGVLVGDSVGGFVGLGVGDGVIVGPLLGSADGAGDGGFVGGTVGLVVGEVVGAGVSLTVCCTLGASVPVDGGVVSEVPPSFSPPTGTVNWWDISWRKFPSPETRTSPCSLSVPTYSRYEPGS
jgi:hypothetical protein